MNIFKKLNSEKKTTAKLPITPIDLYSRLKKEEKYFHLRGIQEEALNLWNEKREKNDKNDHSNERRCAPYGLKRII